MSECATVSPLISVVVAIEALDEIWAKATIDSLLAQTHDTLELIVAITPGGKIDPGDIAAAYADDERVTALPAAPAEPLTQQRR